MKKSIIAHFLLLLMVLVLIQSCNKDDDNDPIDLVPELNGLYVYGTNSVAATPLEPAAKMSRALMNPDKTGGENNVEDIYGKLMYIGANSTIQFTEVLDEASSVYGAPNGGEAVPGDSIDYTDLKDNIIYGTLVEDEDPIGIGNNSVISQIAVQL